MTINLTAFTMSFGGSVSDVLVCYQLAQKVWKGCREAPNGFKAVCTEVASLHLVLNEARETAHDLSASKEEDLRQLINGCKSVLQELEELLQRYKSLGTQSKRTWDRLRWGNELVEDIRQRLRSSTALLTCFNTSLTKYVHHALCLAAQSTNLSCSAGLARVEKLLQQLVMDHQSGLREGSVLSTDNLVCAEEGNEDIWRQIARELDDVGITSDLVREHRAYITDWIIMALETGELTEVSPSSSSPLSDMQEIEHIREDSQLLDRAPDRDQSQDILSPMVIEVSAPETWSPSSQEDILSLYDVALGMQPSHRYYCNMCNHGGTFATWFEVLSHARTSHGGSSRSTIMHYPSSGDNDAVNELRFTMTTLSHAVEDRLIPSNFRLLIYDLYYSEICPFWECRAHSGSPELNRYLASDPSMLDY